MKKHIMGCIAILIGCAVVSINSTAGSVNSHTLMYQTINDTTPPMHHQNHMDSSRSKGNMHRQKGQSMHDSSHRMGMSDSSNGMNQSVDSTHQRL